MRADGDSGGLIGRRDRCSKHDASLSDGRRHGGVRLRRQRRPGTRFRTSSRREPRTPPMQWDSPRPSDYLEASAWTKFFEHERALVSEAYTDCRRSKSDIYGPPASGRSGVMSFTLGDVHPHDLATILDGDGVCIRAGNHCAPAADAAGSMSARQLALRSTCYNDRVRHRRARRRRTQGKGDIRTCCRLTARPDRRAVPGDDPRSLPAAAKQG